MERLGKSNIGNNFLGGQNPNYWYDRIAMSLYAEFETKDDKDYMYSLCNFRIE